ncbi:hypothetical protein PSPO01_07499 [Paraphaeosphaeria sporulosa]
MHAAVKVTCGEHVRVARVVASVWFTFVIHGCCELVHRVKGFIIVSEVSTPGILHHGLDRAIKLT